ncbi:uncharacterized protein AKAME5_000929000 [Lates japonicus]|uniref:Ig-like domain-containing protein n=1 Tax=Lates japonicus TaxID=270547 RepID=A0AAD3MNN8_LATJO|nr:uncharacterized protein AKAME5_000929000 [Lates japonicus]
MSLILILLLQFTAAATGQSSSRLVAKAGDDVTLPCENLKGFQEKCGDTNWIFTRNKFSSELVILGQINENAKADRLSITANCSLVQKKQNYGELLECKVTDKNIGKVVLFALSLQSSGENATTNAIPGWLRFVIVSVGLTALIVSVVTVNIWTRTKGKKTQMDGNDVCYNDYEDYNMMN